MGHDKDDIIFLGIQQYNGIIEEKVKKNEEISELKRKIEKLEIECSNLDFDQRKVEAQMQAEIYSLYSQKDLLKMATRIERLSNKEVAKDFRELVSKFSNHELKFNDISQLHTYYKLYGQYVKEENSIIKGLFKALGGNLDE